ncbi:MAG: DUF1080 domain-containing protein [Sedimentisphaerales bacterium]|nr:DUF1080 domain-containing protein [Sedimentisphaerales bacterium]
MKKCVTGLMCTVMVLSAVSIVSAEDGWIPLFNGKDLTGWKANENTGTFYVRDGMIVANGNRSHLFYMGPVCNADFKDFEFKAEVMTKPSSNSGIYIHTRYQDSGWPAYGYESQVNQTQSDPQKSGGLYDAAKVNPSPAKDNEWYTHRIRVEGNHVQVWIAGTKVVDYEEPENVNFPGWPNRRLSHGTFALQGHDPGSTAYFKNIMVKPLGGCEEGWIRLDNGKDLTGWKKAVESPETFSVRDGAIVANGNRCHLFYEGPVQNADFRNFEYKVDVMTRPNSNGGLYFHTEYQRRGWPSKGFEVQVNNSYNPDPRKTGSLYQVVDLMNKKLVDDDVWFSEHIIVRNREVTIKVNDQEVVCWLQSDDWSNENRRLDHGTFALQGHDPGSTVFYKNIRVKPLDPDPALRGKWVDLFDGKTLAGWTQVNGTAKYEVEDGIIVGTAVKDSPNSFLCTDKLYGDFLLEFEVKVDSSLNSGVQIRSNSYKNYNTFRVHGYQVEIATNGEAGFIYDEARRGWLSTDRSDPAARAAFKDGQWNKYRVSCIGDTIRTWINDVPVANVKDSMTDCGFIGLQVHGVGGEGGQQVRWRNIRLKDMTGAKEKLSVAVVTGGHAYEEKPFWEMFDSMPHVQYMHCDLRDGSELFEDISNWNYDVVVLYNMSQKITPKRQANFKKLLDDGIGLVALHHCMAAFQDWDEYKNIIGAKYYTKPVEGRPDCIYQHDIDMPIQVVDQGHPVTRGLADFVIHDESYKNCWHAPDNHVLLTCSHETSDKTIAWTREFGKARVCTIQLGHDGKAYTNPNYHRLLSQAIVWVAQ